ncbi:MAG: arsenate reductase ArsC [Clostridia bacterium]|nr:arsenate reductase ArsC [Clostridia bacterium]
MKKIAFVCITNSCRSQMAEAFCLQLGKGQVKSYSAGLNPVFSIDENAIMVMAEKGIKMDNQYPKKMGDIPDCFDVLITLGDDSFDHYIKADKREVWHLDDPKGKDINAYRRTRDLIYDKVEKLVNEIQVSV